MKATTTYNDLVGTISVNATQQINNGVSLATLEGIGNFLDIDQEKYTIVGISLYGIQSTSIKLFCIDNTKSNESHEELVEFYIDVSDKSNIFLNLFESMEIILFPKHDEKYSNVSYFKSVEYNE